MPFRALAAVLLASAGLLAAAAVVLGEDETTRHALLHAMPAAVVAALALLVARRGLPTPVRAGIFTFLVVVAVAQLAESLGAFGWDDSQVIEERPALTAVHDAALGGPFLAPPVAAAVVAVLLLAQRRRARG